jgi:hypothetical protein
MGRGTATDKQLRRPHNAQPCRPPQKRTPAGKPETLPGPFARLGRVTGMEKPGALAETGIWKVVLDPTHSLSVFMRIAHIWMLHCSILIAPGCPIYLCIEAGHLARPRDGEFR